MERSFGLGSSLSLMIHYASNYVGNGNIRLGEDSKDSKNSKNFFKRFFKSFFFKKFKKIQRIKIFALKKRIRLTGEKKS